MCVFSDKILRFVITHEIDEIDQIHKIGQMTLFSFLFTLPNQGVNIWSCKMSGHSVKAMRFLWSN